MEMMIGLLTKARDEAAEAIAELNRLIDTKVEEDPESAKQMLDRAQALMVAAILYDER